MTDKQLDAKDWLNRMYRTSMHIESLKSKQEEVLASMSGIGKYDSEHVSAQTGENSSETKFLNYSYYADKIENELKRLYLEDIRTSEVIEMLGQTPEDETMKSILNYRYLERLPWEKVAEKINYSLPRVYELHAIALTKIYPFIPKGEVEYEDLQTV